jgi:hypothetical protein
MLDLAVQWVPVLFPGELSGQGVMLITDVHLTPRLRMTGTILLLPPYNVIAYTGKTSTLPLFVSLTRLFRFSNLI